MVEVDYLDHLASGELVQPGQYDLTKLISIFQSIAKCCYTI